MHVQIQCMCIYDYVISFQNLRQSEYELLYLPKYPQQFFLPALVPTLLIHIKHVHYKITLYNIFTIPLFN